MNQRRSIVTTSICEYNLQIRFTLHSIEINDDDEVNIRIEPTDGTWTLKHLGVPISQEDLCPFVYIVILIHSLTRWAGFVPAHFPATDKMCLRDILRRLNDKASLQKDYTSLGMNIKLESNKRQ